MIALLSMLLVSSQELTISDGGLSPKAKVTIEARTTFRQKVQPEPDASPMKVELVADFAWIVTVSSWERLSAEALVDCTRAQTRTTVGEETVEENEPLHGRRYRLRRDVEEVEIERTDAAADSPAEPIGEDESLELRMLTDTILFASPLMRALAGKKMAPGETIAFDLEEAQLLFEMSNQGAKLEKCELELVGKRRVGAHDCAAFKVRLRRLDATEPDFDFEVVEEVEGELVATLAHGFPLSCKLAGSATPRPRKGAPTGESVPIPDAGGTREWTWSAKLE